LAQLRNQFTSWKRSKRQVIATLRRSAIGESVYTGYERLKTSIRGPRTVYPFAITKEDFGFDGDNMNVAKWFLCVCAARAR
jgi:hypothetical protein